MTIRERFDFLVSQYGMNYGQLTVDDYCGSGGKAYAHSFYNDSGCFTIFSFPVKGELECFISDVYEANLNVLCKQPVDMRAIESEIWKKHAKRGLLSRLFFWNRPEKVLAALAEALVAHMSKYEDVFCLKMSGGIDGNVLPH